MTPKYFGVLKNNEFLLSTLPADEEEKIKAMAVKWSFIFPDDQIEVVGLSYRSKDGWRLSE